MKSGSDVASSVEDTAVLARCLEGVGPGGVSAAFATVAN